MTSKKRNGMAATICSLCIITPTAHALSIEGFDLLDLYAGAAVEYNDNIFRLPQTPTVPVTGIASRSDRITSGRAGVGLDKSYGLQRWKLDANIYRYRYARNRFLDYSATNYNALWQWQFTPEVKGNLSFDREQKPVNFSDYTNYSQKNIRTSENRRFDVDWRISGGWHSLAAISRINEENSSLFTTEASYSERVAEAGLKYEFPSGSALTLNGREARGTYLDRILDPVALLDTRFNRHELETLLFWLLTGKTTVNARLAHLTLKHENFAQRDYRGMVGHLDYNWNISGKLLLNGRIERSLNTYQDLTSSYYVNRQVRLSPVWLMTEKTRAHIVLNSAWQDYRGSVQQGLTQPRRDRLNTIEIGVGWKPIEKVSLALSVQREERKSSSPLTQEYKDLITRMSVQLRF